MQKNLIDFTERKTIRKIRSKDTDYPKWIVDPEHIFQFWNDSLIDREYAIFILETLFYEEPDEQRTKKKRIKIIEFITEISRPNKKLFRFLEGVVFTEFWYLVKFEALYQLHRLFKKKKMKLLMKHLFKYEPGLFSYTINNSTISKEKLFFLNNSISFNNK